MKDAYSYPRYCDIAYGWDRSGECDFIEGCVKRYCGGGTRSLLDIACGTGIHMREFARRGYSVTGIDRSEEMAGYVRHRARAEGLDMECLCSDMAKFGSDKRFGCAVCLLDSFRYLISDEDVISHLGCVAAALEAGALYIIDMWMPRDDKIGEWEDISWTRERDGVRVDARYIQHGGTFDPVKRTFRDELIFKVKGPDFNSTLTSLADTKLFLSEDLAGLIRRSGDFDPAGRFYNFDFSGKEVYNKSIRTIIVLKKRR